MAIDSATSLLFKIGANADDATENIARFRSLFSSDLGQLQTQIGSWAEEVFGKFESVKSAMMGLGAAAAAALVAIGAGLFEMTRKAAEAGEEMGNLAQQTGIPVQQLSGLKVLAGETGISFDTMTSAAVMMSRQLSPVASSSSTAGKALQMMGLSAYDSGGHMKGTIEIMAMVADKFKGMKDGAEKTALAQAIFSRSGAQLIPILDEGGDALRRAAGRAKDLGQSWDDLSVKKARQFQESMKDAKFAIAGVSLSIGQEMMPAVTAAVSGISNFIVRNSADIRDFASGITSVMNGVGAVFKGVWDTLEAVGKAVALIAFEIAQAAIASADALRGHFRDAWEDLKAGGAGFVEEGKNVLHSFDNFKSSGDDATASMIALGRALTEPPKVTTATAAAVDKLAQSLTAAKEAVESLQDSLSKPDAAALAQYQRAVQAADNEIAAQRRLAAAGKISREQLGTYEREYSELVTTLARERDLKLRQAEQQRVQAVAQLDQDLQEKIDEGQKKTLAQKLAAISAEIAAERQKYAKLGALDAAHEQLIAERRAQLTIQVMQEQADAAAKAAEKQQQEWTKSYNALSSLTDSYATKAQTGEQRVTAAYQAEINKIYQLRDTLLKLGVTDQQRAQIAQQVARAIAAAQQQEQRSLNTLAAEKWAAAWKQSFQSVQQALGQFHSQYTSFAKDFLDAINQQVAAQQEQVKSGTLAAVSLSQGVVGALKQQAIVKAIYETAESIAAFASLDFRGGAMHALAAAQYGLVAGAQIAGMLGGGGSGSGGRGSGSSASTTRAAASTGGGSTSGSSSATTVNVHIDGVISADNLAAVVQQINGSVGNGSATLTASHVLVGGAVVATG